MHRRSGLPLFVVLILCSSSLVAPAQERQIGGVGLTLFADRNFRGRSATVRDDTPDLRSINMNDVARSLRVGPGETWEVCEHIEFQGRCVVVSGSEADLRQTRWDRIISSARRVSGRGGIRPPVQPVPADLELFSRTGFGGDRRAFTTQQADLRRDGFNDAAQSLRIARGQSWQVCADANFGNCQVVNSDWSDLRGLGMSRRISSVRPFPQGGGSRGRLSITLFDDRRFRGESLVVDRESRSLQTFANRAESVRVAGGSWELCDGAGFSGRCRVISNDVPDLGLIGLRNRVVSVRPAPTPR